MVNCLLLVTGSVAAIKTFKLQAELLKQLPKNENDENDKNEVRIVTTESAQHFLGIDAQIPEGTTKEEVLKNSKIFRDQDEWDTYKHRGDPVLHIELRKWADIAVVAPLDANSLAKISHGLADNLLSCVMRAWEWQTKPVVLAPAMNTAMWEHPLTLPQLEVIKSFGRRRRQTQQEKNPDLVVVVDPVGKKLECNDVGVGAMAAVEDIAAVAAKLVGEVKKKS